MNHFNLFLWRLHMEVVLIQNILEKNQTLFVKYFLLILSIILEQEVSCDVSVCVYWETSDFLACYFLKS